MNQIVMNKYYFTFGSDEQFPYGQNEYVVVKAPDLVSAHRLFQMIHPNPRIGHENLSNCAFAYSEERFNEFKDKYYKGVEPSEIIRVTVERN